MFSSPIDPTLERCVRADKQSLDVITTQLDALLSECQNAEDVLAQATTRVANLRQAIRRLQDRERIARDNLAASRAVYLGHTPTQGS